MKLKNIGRAALATALSLAIGLGATACSRDYTVAYVYSVSKATGNISAFAVDYQSGALSQIDGSPFTNTVSGGTSGATAIPLAIVAAPSGQFLYVLNNAAAAISEYAVGTDGKLYGIGTANPTGIGSYPTSGTIDSTGCYLYVTQQLQAGYTTASPGKGEVDIYPIISSSCNNGSGTEGTLGTPTVVPVGNNPIDVQVSLPYCYTGSQLNVSANPSCNNNTGHDVVYVYVVDQENEPTPPTSVQPNVPSTLAPQLLGFTQNMTNGKLTTLSGTTCTAVAGSPCTGTAVGVGPSAVAIEPTTRYVYVTDALSNQIYSYGIASNTTGNLTGLTSSPTASGQYPIQMTIDPRGKFLLTANYNDQTVGSYSINTSNGSLGAVSGTSAATVPASPTCVTIEPALGIYVYTSNTIDGSISGEHMDPNTGALTTIANSPFPTSSQPSCLVAVANGSHARSLVNP
jgi:6-phosphogluconolactonase